jgi:hypothetical protein
MRDTKQIYEDLISIISKVTKVPIENLYLDTTINIDLEIYGDDWDELMWPILDKYPIDEHSEFEYSRHMKPEFDLILPLLFEIILTIPRLLIGAIIYPFSKKMGSRIQKKRIINFLMYENQPLYIADIYNSILKGKWEYAKNSDLNLIQLINYMDNEQKIKSKMYPPQT